MHSIKTRKTFPYPTKNPLYNIKGNNGYVFPVKLCLIGIVTCDDDGGRKAAGTSYTMATVLDSLGESRYRLPSPSIEGRYNIYLRLFEKSKIELSADAKEDLMSLAASMPIVKGRAFLEIRKRLIQTIDRRMSNKPELGRTVNLDELNAAFKQGSGDLGGNLRVSSSTAKDPNSSAKRNKLDTTFSSIGGNVEAKRALEDALAFDDKKRRLLAKFGLSPPCGVLMYGPPGTGKTLLAKATAQMMRKDSPSTGSRTNGLFLSLSASDIVRSEVGKSEKLVKSAFDMARENAPAVIFIDEFQALFTSRDGATGAGKGSGRLASTLLQCMDDITKWKDADSLVLTKGGSDGFGRDRVVVLGATNTPWMVDKAFLRSGRFDRVRDRLFENRPKAIELHHMHITILSFC